MQFYKLCFCLSLISSVLNLGSIFATLVPSAQIDTFDYIVNGAGSSGSPLATELAEAGYKVALVEFGPTLDQLLDQESVKNLDNHKWVRCNPQVETYYFSTPQLRTLSNGTSFFKSEELRRAKLEGGCNRHNGGWARYGVPQVYDTFPSGWKRRDLAPYLDKAFRRMSSDIPRKNRSLQNKIMNEWHQATGHPLVPDSNLYSKTQLGIQRSIFNYIEKNDSYCQRYSSFDAFVMKSRQLNRNLIRIPNTLVERVVWEFERDETEPRARGVEVTDRVSGLKRTLYAKKEVIISMGTYDTTTMLQRSGIGNCTELESVYNVQCVIDSPKVGAEFVYHMVLASLMTVNPQDAVIGPNSQFHTQVGVGISTQGQSYPDATIDFHMETNPVFLPSPPLPVPVAFGILLSLRDFGPGTIKMDPSDHHKPLVDLKLFQNDWEIPHLDTMFQEYRRLLNTSSVYQFEISPGMGIQSETERYDFIKQNINDGAHPVASNQIGQVVDDRLRVMGAKGLRIVDLSIIPKGNHANPNMLAVAIGLKGADIILRDARSMD